MSRRICWVWVVVLLGLIIALFLARFVSSGEAEASLQRFDRDVRASTEILDGLAVQNRGRIKPLDSFARERLFDIFGERACAGLKPTLVILSWALCPDGWSEKPIIKLAPALTAEFCDGNASISATHISPKQLREKLHARAGSAMTGSSDRKKSRSWRKLKKRLMRFNMLAGDLRLFPRGGAEGWIALGAEAALEIDGARDAYKMLTSSLDTLDVRQYNEAASRLAAISSSTDDGFHPPRWRLVLEVHYNRIGPFWLLAVMYLAIALIYSLGYVTNSGKLARAASVVLYPVAAFHILAIVTRGIIAEKAMASNTYEYILVMTAVTAIAALVLKARGSCPEGSFQGAGLRLYRQRAVRRWTGRHRPVSAVRDGLAASTSPQERLDDVSRRRGGAQLRRPIPCLRGLYRVFTSLRRSAVGAPLEAFCLRWA